MVARLATRNFVFPEKEFNELEAARKTVQTKTEDLQQKRNVLSRQIGMAKKNGEDASALMTEAAQIPEELTKLEAELDDIRTRLNDMLLRIPNLPHESVPVGKDESENVEVRRWGTPREFDFEVKDHVDVGAPLGLRPPRSPAPASPSCAVRLPVFIAPSPSSCWTRTPVKTAMSSATPRTS